jgi:hypothetical protein
MRSNHSLVAAKLPPTSPIPIILPIRLLSSFQPFPQRICLRRELASLKYTPPAQGPLVLQEDLDGISGVAFGGAVRTLETSALADAVERLLSDDVAAGHHHGGVCVGGLFFGDGADEDGVEVIGLGEGDFDLRTC